MATNSASCVILSPPALGSSSVADRLGESLRATAWGAGFTDLAVRIEHGSVHLSGSVSSYHLKQMAQFLAARQTHGLSVVNSLVVRSVR